MLALAHLSAAAAAAEDDVEMFTASLSSEQQRQLAKRLTTFLSHYSHLSDSYIIVRKLN